MSTRTKRMKRRMTAEEEEERDWLTQPIAKTVVWMLENITLKSPSHPLIDNTVPLEMFYLFTLLQYRCLPLFFFFFLPNTSYFVKI